MVSDLYFNPQKEKKYLKNQRVCNKTCNKNTHLYSTKHQGRIQWSVCYSSSKNPLKIKRIKEKSYTTLV